MSNWGSHAGDEHKFHYAEEGVSVIRIQEKGLVEVFKLLWANWVYKSW